MGFWDTVIPYSIQSRFIVIVLSRDTYNEFGSVIVKGCGHTIIESVSVLDVNMIVLPGHCHCWCPNHKHRILWFSAWKSSKTSFLFHSFAHFPQHASPYSATCHSNCVLSFIMHIQYTFIFLHPQVQTAHTHTSKISKYPLARILSSELHGNHSLTPITMATGISITHAFFTDQFPLCLLCLSLCLPPFARMRFLLLSGKKSAKPKRNDQVIATDRSVCLSDVPLRPAEPAATGKLPLRWILSPQKLQPS